MAFRQLVVGTADIWQRVFTKQLQRGYQHINGPVSFTWVLRICWNRTNLEIQEHSMLYKLPPIQKHQEQIWHCHKSGQSQSRHHLKKKKTNGMGLQPLGTSSGSILKLLFYYSHHIVPVPDRSLLPHYFIWYFVLFHTCKPQGKRRQPLGTIFLMQAERSYHFDHVAFFNK